MKACRDIDRDQEMKKFRTSLGDMIRKAGLNSEQIKTLILKIQIGEMIKESGLTYDQVRKMCISILEDKPVEIEHVTYSPEECGRDK